MRYIRTWNTSMHVTSRAPSSFTNSTRSTRFCNANYPPTLKSRARLPPSSRKLNWFSIKKLRPRDCSDNYLFKLFLVGIKWLRLSFLDADTETRLFAIQFTPLRHRFLQWIRPFTISILCHMYETGVFNPAIMDVCFLNSSMSAASAFPKVPLIPSSLPEMRITTVDPTDMHVFSDFDHTHSPQKIDGEPAGLILGEASPHEVLLNDICDGKPSSSEQRSLISSESTVSNFRIPLNYYELNANAILERH